MGLLGGGRLWGQLVGWDRVGGWDGELPWEGTSAMPQEGCYKGIQPGSTPLSLLPGSEMRLLALTHAVTIASQHVPPTVRPSPEMC